MHECLQIPEIVELIFDQISDVEKPYAEPTGRYANHLGRKKACTVLATRASQLLALAQTCRQFQQPAILGIWETIHGVAPIIKCVGKDLWTTNGYRRLVLARSITPSDVEIMRKYASYVREYHAQDRSGGVWIALRDVFAGTFLFPNLRTIYWTHNGYWKFNALFNIQSVTSFTLSPGTNPPSWLSDFLARCPALKSLCLDRLDDPELLRVAFQALPNLPHLSLFMTNTGTPEILQAFANCPTLRYINFGTLHEGAEWLPLTSETDSHTIFPMLEGIVFGCKRLSDAIKLLDVLPSDGNLQRLDIAATSTNHWVKEKELLSLLHSLKRYSHSLKEFRARDEWSFPEIYDRAIHNTLFFARLAHFKALTHFNLTCSRHFVFVDEDVKMLTEALPLLEDFHLLLCRPGCWEGKPLYEIGTTLKCLTFFASNCPNISKLSIVFEAIQEECIDYLDVKGWLECSSRALKLQFLDVSISRLDWTYCDEAAEFLLHLFPSIRWMEWETYSGYKWDPKGEHSRYLWAWAAVSKFAKKKKVGLALKQQSDT